MLHEHATALDTTPTFTTLEGLPSGDYGAGTYGAAYGINNRGDIVGTYVGGGLHGFLYSNGTYTTLDAPGSFDTQVFGINDRGQIAGDAEA